MGNRLIPRSRLERELSALQQLPAVPPTRLRLWLWKVTELSGPASVLVDLLQRGEVAYRKCLVGESCSAELRALGEPLLRLGYTAETAECNEYVLAAEWARVELVELLSSSAG